VEFAVVLPLVLLLALGLLQVGVVVRDHLALGLAAREGARAAAVSADAASAARAAVDAVLPAGTASVSTSTGDTMVTVEVRSTVSVALPVVGVLIAGRELSATATMALDPLDPP
jgi:Flp pilus assembly protein TadG